VPEDDAVRTGRPDGTDVALGGPEVLLAGDPEAIATAAAALGSGGIVGLPTETVYGVAVLPRPESLRALLLAKQRPSDKGIPLLIDQLDQVAGLVVVPPTALRLAACFWPGPLTLALPLRHPDGVPQELSGGRASLAVRIPDHAVPRGLARLLGPIAVTSANRSGEREARDAAELMASVGASLALIIDDGPVRGGVPSSVVTVDADGRVELRREGAIRWTDLEAALGDVGDR
jgi:L-threonylcarbamoyladenylate synthase